MPMTTTQRPQGVPHKELTTPSRTPPTTPPTTPKAPEALRKLKSAKPQLAQRTNKPRTLQATQIKKPPTKDLFKHRGSKGGRNLRHSHRTEFYALNALPRNRIRSKSSKSNSNRPARRRRRREEREEEKDVDAKSRKEGGQLHLHSAPSLVPKN